MSDPQNSEGKTIISPYWFWSLIMTKICIGIQKMEFVQVLNV